MGRQDIYSARRIWPRLQDVESALRADAIPVVEGPPGAGKSAAMGELARHLGWGFVALCPATCDPADIGGLDAPVAPAFGTAGRTRLERLWPWWLEAAEAEIAAGKAGVIVFFDELKCLAPASQAACLSIFQERRVGPHKLSDKIRLCGACNPADSAANGQDFEPAFANRVVHIAWELDAAEWCAWLEGTEDSTGAHKDVATYLRGTIRTEQPRRNALADPVTVSGLHAMPMDREARGGPWPSPRTWHVAARLLQSGREMQIDAGKIERTVAGAIGATAARLLFESIESPIPDVMDVLGGKIKLSGKVLTEPTVAARFLDALNAREKNASPTDLVRVYSEMGKVTALRSTVRAKLGALLARSKVLQESEIMQNLAGAL
ncbi:MAG: hypothetical protein AABY75_05515 [Bacteroidota bacterium]